MMTNIIDALLVFNFFKRRISRGQRRYYYNVIGGTPFELIVALPDPYGLNRVESVYEIGRARANQGKSTFSL